MNSNYIEINQDDNSLGTLAIQKNVFSDLVKQVIKNSDSSQAVLHNKVNISYSEGELVLNIEVMLKYGNRALGVIENVQRKIFEVISNGTSVSDVIINISVVGFIF